MNIKDIRTRKGLTQAEVASALGVSSVVYSRYETGTTSFLYITLNYTTGTECDILPYR